MEEQSKPRARAVKVLVDDDGFSFMEKFRKEMNDRPWYDKLYSKIKMLHWVTVCTFNYVISKNPYYVKGADAVAESIKDDIEFGYDLDMIYGKIMSGSYGNTEMPAKRDWFTKHKISWDFFLDRQGGIKILQTLNMEMEYRELKTKEDIKKWMETQIENYYNEKRLRMQAQGIPVEEVDENGPEC